MKSHRVLYVWIGTNLAIGLLWQVSRVLLSASKTSLTLSNFFHRLCPNKPQSIPVDVGQCAIDVAESTCAWDLQGNCWVATVIPGGFFENGEHKIVWSQELKLDEKSGELVPQHDDVYSFESPLDATKIPMSSKAAADALRLLIPKNALSDALEKHFVCRTGSLKNGAEWYTCITSSFSHRDLQHLCWNMAAMFVQGSLLLNTCPVFEAEDLNILLVCSLVGSSAISLAYHERIKAPIDSFGASGVVEGLQGATAVLIFATADTGAARLLGVALLVRVGIAILDNFIGLWEHRGIDCSAHIGGVLSGVMYAVLWLGIRT